MKMTFKRIVCVVCILSVLVLMQSPLITHAASTYQNTSLITSVSNSQNGQIKITLSVPANTKVTIEAFPNELSGNKQYGPMIEKKVAYVTNNTAKKKSMSKTISIGYYGEYIIHASHGWKGSIWDEHKCISKLGTTVYTSKVKWTSDRIKKFKNGCRFVAAIQGGGELLMVAVLPLGKTAKTFIDVALVGKNAISAGSATIASEKTINITPIEGYSWRYKLVGDSNSIKTYLECYNKAGALSSTTHISTSKYDSASKRIKVIS